MPLPEQTTVLDRVRTYFGQQAELVGPELFGVRIDALSRLAEEQAPRIQSLEQTVLACRKCALSETRKHVVFGVGDPDANLMLIGEAPGEEEDKQGIPFVGKAGQLLDKILAAIGFERSEVYIANILKCRPPGNRDPEPDEIALCKTHLDRQIRAVRPKVILALGRIAGQVLLRSESSLGRMRGQSFTYLDVPVVVTYHPAALLRNPQWKRAAWEDVQKLRHVYDRLAGDKPAWQPPKSSR